ncbi:acyltransferase family protein [Kibdelosporangium aridum]|uniref:acyltransferase family protein n=1 Tax=Kibdelosporangium aridum TaxID=2030 RepID=UPI0006896DFA
MTQLQPTGIARKAHQPALDGLRGVAILGVLLFHSDYLSGGFLGVDLFFALSGYLITDLLLREIEVTGAVSLVAFWGRRIRRLLPALATMLAVTAVVVWAVGSPEMVRTTLSDGPWVQANLVNWHLLAQEASYWDRFGEGEARVFEHLWSIAVEEQFYLVWPALLLAIAWCGRRRVDGRVAVIAALASVASLVLMIALVNSVDPTRVYTGTDTRAFSLLLGAMVATRPARAMLARVVDRRGVVVLTLTVGIGTAWLLVDGVNSVWLFTGGLFAHSLASALLIGLCVQAPQALVAKVLAWQPIRWLGLISYSLYLWHWPVFVLLSPQRGWVQTVAALAVSIALAALSKYLVEDPVRFRARWAVGRSGLFAFVALMIGLAALWILLPAPAPATIDITELGMSAACPTPGWSG